MYLLKVCCTVTVALSLKHGKVHKGQYCFICLNHCGVWREQNGAWGHWGVRGRKENSFFISFQIRVVVLSWVLPLRSGCVGIPKNNRLRLFASFSNQLQLNAKTSADPMFLSNIHPPSGSTRCCSPYFTWKQMLRGGKWHWRITARCSCTPCVIGHAFLFILHIHTRRQNWDSHSWKSQLSSTPFRFPFLPTLHAQPAAE